MTASYAAALLVLALFSFSLYTFLYVVPEETRQYVLSNELFQRLYDELVVIFYAWTFLSVLRGFFLSNFSQMFNQSDLTLLFSSPIVPVELYISKYLKDVLRRLIFLVISFLTAAPVICYINLRPAQLLTTFAVLAVFIEVTYVLRYLTFFVVQRMIPHLRSLKTLLIFEFLIVSFFYLGFTDSARIIRNRIIQLSLPTVAVQALFQTVMDFPAWPPTSLLVAYLVSTYLVLSLSAFIISGNYYEKVAMAHENPWRLGFEFMKDHIPWHLNRRYGPFVMIALKDLWLHLRQYGKIFLIGILISYGSLGIAIWYRPLLAEMFSSTYQVQAFLLFILPIMASLFICYGSPSPYVFTLELGDLWILKVSPLPPKTIVYGKYFYGVLVSAILGLPMIAVLILLFSPESHQWTMTVLTPQILFTCNAVGMMISAYFSSAPRDKASLPFVAYLAYLFLTLFITELMTIALLGFPYLFIMMIAMISLSTALIVWICLKLTTKALIQREDLE